MTKSIIVLGALALFACSSDGGGDPTPVTNAPASATDDASEAKAPTATKAPADDAPVATDPSLGSSDPATAFVPLLDWSFESASPDCNGWPVSGSDAAIRAIPAKTGSYSCKVCANGTSADLELSRSIGKVAKGHYALRAYVRKRAQTAAPSEAIATIKGARSTVVTSEPVAVREQWDLVQAFIDLDEDSDDVTISIGSADAAAQNCLFVDDVVFTRTN